MNWTALSLNIHNTTKKLIAFRVSECEKPVWMRWHFGESNPFPGTGAWQWTAYLTLSDTQGLHLWSVHSKSDGESAE